MTIPLTKPLFDREEEKAVIDVLRSGWIMQGAQVDFFEIELAAYVGSRYAVLVSSGTAALHLALLALGIAKNDEVITPSLSFIASANCILYVGATPVFADCDEQTYNIDPNDIEKKITSKTKAVIAVHQIGLPAEIDAIQTICKKHHLFFIEDAACALGSEYKGKKVGNFGDLACFSFHPRKSITTGEGGFITTNSKTLSERLKRLRSHGMSKEKEKETYRMLGFNYRLTDLQAAIGRAQLKKLDEILEKRKKLAERYTAYFSQSKTIIPPFSPDYVKHTYQSYMVKLKNKKVRDQMSQQLTKNGIANKKGIMLIHKEPLYLQLFPSLLLPVSEYIADTTLIIPFFPQMTKKEQNVILNSLNNF